MSGDEQIKGELGGGMVGLRGDVYPRPDPTRLTTEQLIREVASLKEVVFTRLDGMDKAITLFNENITRVPTDTDKQITHLKNLHEARFETNDQAIVLQQTILDRIPVQIDDKIRALRKLEEEKIAALQNQLVAHGERHTRSEAHVNEIRVAQGDLLRESIEGVGRALKDEQVASKDARSSIKVQIDMLSGSIDNRFTRIYEEAKTHGQDDIVHHDRLRVDFKESLSLAVNNVRENIVTAMTSSKEAIAKAEAANEKRFDAVDEFRQTLTQQQSTFISRIEHDGVIARMTERIQDLTDRLNLTQGHTSGMTDGWKYALGALGGVASLAGIIGMIIALTNAMHIWTK